MTYVTKTDKREFVIQRGAAGINPSGAIGAAVYEWHGIGGALKYVDAATRAAGVNFRLNSLMDLSSEFSIRIAFDTDTNTGDVRWGVKYRYLSDDEDTTLIDGEVIINSTVSAVVNGFVNQSFVIPSPEVGDKVLKIEILRYGGDALDTCTSDAYLMGVSLVGQEFTN